MSLKNTFHIKYNGATTVSTAANVTSDPFDIISFPLISVHVWFTGSPTGSVTFDVSNYEDSRVDGYLSWTNQDPALNTLIPHWITLASVKTYPLLSTYTATTTTAGTPAEMAFNFQNLGFRWMRMTYTGNGTGVMEARVCGKRNKSSKV